MNLRNQIFCFVMLLAGLANGMSDEWHGQIAASWELARAEFPGCDKPPSPIFARIREIDAWAKENNEALYLNSNKPYLMAQMVQREIESATKAAKHEAESEERRKALAQEVAASRQAKTEQPPIGNKSLEDLFKGDPSLSSIIRRHNSPNTAAIWLGATIIIILSFVVAWGLHWIIRPRHGANSAISFGRKWAAWAVAILTISMLPSFFRKLDGSSLALWTIGVVGWGIFAFFIGWIIGLFKFRKRHSAEPSPSISPPPITEALAANAQKDSVKIIPEVLATDQLSISQDAKNKTQRLPLIMNNIKFEVEIPEGEKLENGYVEMRHNTQYSLILRNHPWVACDAEVAIDGIHVGTWRIEPRGEIQIERPVHDTGHFTFFQVGTEEADMAGITKNPDNGLISVTFKPKKESNALRAGPLPGATGLSGESSQRFVDAIEIEHDMSRAFTIHIRLISKQPNIRPLGPRSTPIPPPIG